MSESKKMCWSTPEGGMIFLEWPDNISLESLEMAEEVIALQLRSVRRAIERKKAKAAHELPAEPAATQPKGEGQ